MNVNEVVVVLITLNLLLK